MSDINVIASIQHEKNNDMTANGKPALNEEHVNVMSVKRMTFDEPPYFKKQDPLR